jgi:hypothetical protein
MTNARDGLCAMGGIYARRRVIGSIRIDSREGVNGRDVTPGLEYTAAAACTRFRAIHRMGAKMIRRRLRSRVARSVIEPAAMSNRSVLAGSNHATRPSRRLRRTQVQLRRSLDRACGFRAPVATSPAPQARLISQLLRRHKPV